MNHSFLFVLSLMIGNGVSAFVVPYCVKTRVTLLKESLEDDSEVLGIPQLPPIGYSSFGSSIPSIATAQPVANVVSEKFELQYTCKICETRNFHRVSRIGKFHTRIVSTTSGHTHGKKIYLHLSFLNELLLAYRTGVVICCCKGCTAKHLIADNLGWHNYIGGFEGDSNIEEYMATRGMGGEVNRVTEDVFELEKLLDKTGVILDENGRSVLE